jgi:hypothetical protein
MAHDQRWSGLAEIGHFRSFEHREENCPNRTFMLVSHGLAAWLLDHLVGVSRQNRHQAVVQESGDTRMLWGVAIRPIIAIGVL